MLLTLPSRTVTANATLTANLASLGATIPANFVGFSFENSDIIAGYYRGTTGAAASYLGCASLLGSSGDIRIGGTSSEHETPPALTQQMANEIHSFVASLGAGWTFAYNLDLFANDSATAVTHANYITNAFGPDVVLQMCNEPFGSGNYTTVTFPPAWNAYYSAITASLPNAKFAAFDDAYSQHVQTVIPALTPGIAGLSALTMHWYGSYSPQFLTADQLAEAIWQTGIPASGGYGLLSNIAFAGSTPTRLIECNTRASEGVAGISNAMMSNAWVVNLAIALALGGYAGINIHAVIRTFGTGARYNPIQIQSNGMFKPTPIFCGMMLVARIAGQQIVSLTNTGNPYIRAIATKAANGNANILAVNNHASQAISVRPGQSSAWSTALVLDVASATGSGSSDTSAKIGGQVIGESGVWSGTPYSINNGDCVVIQPCGAALISILS